MNYTDTLIEDYINTHIIEESDLTISKAEVKKIFDQCVAKCNTISGLHINNVIFGGTDTTKYVPDKDYHIMGITDFIYKNGQPYSKISICADLRNKYAKDYLLSVIYHELAHAIDFNNLYDRGIIVPSDDFGVIVPKPSEDGKELLATNGHGESWHAIADKMNKILKLTIPITQSFEDQKDVNFLADIR